MSEAVIVSACRTAIGTARQGMLADVDPLDLGAEVVAAALARYLLLAEVDEDVILGETLAGGGDIARYVDIEVGSLGHPIAMTGARMLVTLIHELKGRGGGIGVAAMCAGGGMSTATVIDVPGN